MCGIEPAHQPQVACERPLRLFGPVRAEAASPHARIATRKNEYPMDIEHINSIGTLLADLTARTQQLRGYL